MKNSILVTFVAVGLLVLAIAPRAYAEPDELEALLAGDAALAQDETQPATVEADAPRAVDSSFKDHPQWQSVVNLPPVMSGSAHDQAVDVPDHKPSPSSPINAVPEPSAIILALAALGYFLLFGRRRRVI